MTLTEGKDQDRFKGALEQDDRTQPGNNSLQGQLGHRDQDPLRQRDALKEPQHRRHQRGYGSVTGTAYSVRHRPFTG